jgi:tetratricopeptide (TPR) repeat protein
MAAPDWSATDRGQIDRAERARGAWRDGNLDSADLLIDTVLGEKMSPAVAAKCYSIKAGIALARKDAAAAMRALDKMAPFLEAANIRIQGTFYLQRGRAHRSLNNIDAALTDYSGSLALWQMCGDKNYEGAAYINLAECYLRLSDIEQAYFNIEQAFAVLPDLSEYLCNAYDTKAKILLADGKTEKAYRLIEKALASSGGNELWEKEFLETKTRIKERLICLLVPLAKMKDLDVMKLQMVQNALEKAQGSVTIAAEMLGTSHQVIAYTADAQGLDRSKRKKSIIKL